ARGPGRAGSSSSGPTTIPARLSSSSTRSPFNRELGPSRDQARPEGADPGWREGDRREGGLLSRDWLDGVAQFVAIGCELNVRHFEGVAGGRVSGDTEDGQERRVGRAPPWRWLNNHGWLVSAA